MEDAIIQRLESSFKLIAPRAPEWVDHFYAHLFSKNPMLRPLFPRDMSSQKQEFLGTFMLLVQNFRKPEKIRQLLMDLGRRHVSLATHSDHYPIIRDTLIGVMKDMAGPQWSEQLTLDWASALNFAAAMMIEIHTSKQKAQVATAPY